MRALNIIGLVLVIALFFATGVYINDVSAERRSNFSSYGFTSLFSNPSADLTVEAI